MSFAKRSPSHENVRSTFLIISWYKARIYYKKERNVLTSKRSLVGIVDLKRLVIRDKKEKLKDLKKKTKRNH